MFIVGNSILSDLVSNFRVLKVFRNQKLINVKAAIQEINKDTQKLIRMESH